MKMKFLLAPLVAFTLAACGGDKSAPADNAQAASDAAANKGTVVRVAVEPVYPPFVQSLPAGQFEGFDIDVLNAAAEKGGFTVSFSPYPWTGLLERLNNNEVDIVAGGMSVTEERSAQYDFSHAYNEEGMVLVLPKDSTIKSFNELRNKKVAYQPNTGEAAELQKVQGGELPKELGENSAWLSFKRVLGTDGQTPVDATIGASSSMHYYADKYANQGITILPLDNLPKRPTAFVVKKGNTELLSKLNKGLDAIKADGTLQKLHDKWLHDTNHSSHAAASHTH